MLSDGAGGTPIWQLCHSGNTGCWENALWKRIQQKYEAEAEKSNSWNREGDLFAPFIFKRNFSAFEDIVQ